MCQARGIDPRTLAGACFRGGARWLQLRHKGSSSGFLALADDIARVARGFDGAKVIVNDRADVCQMARCGGVHVGQEDLSVEDAREVVGPDAIVGVSTHDRAQVDAALATTATYIAVGPIYSTSTKDTGYEARGLELVAYAAHRGKPVVAIGGITLARAPEVVRAGAAAVAVITDP